MRCWRAHMQIADELVAHIRRGLTLSQALSTARFRMARPSRLVCYRMADR